MATNTSRFCRRYAAVALVLVLDSSRKRCTAVSLLLTTSPTLVSVCYATVVSYDINFIQL